MNIRLPAGDPAKRLAVWLRWEEVRAEWLREVERTERAIREDGMTYREQHDELEPLRLRYQRMKTEVCDLDRVERRAA